MSKQIPQSGEARAKYAMDVMSKALYNEEGICTNVEISRVDEGNFFPSEMPKWNWGEYDYRIKEPPKIRYVNVYKTRCGGMFISLQKCISEGGKRAIDRIRITGEGAGATYESIGLDATE